jgi:hypothetical protein
MLLQLVFEGTEQYNVMCLHGKEKKKKRSKAGVSDGRKQN